MKTVTIFEAADGQRFNSPSDCLSYEELASDVQMAMHPLGSGPELTHTGWRQRDRRVCLDVKASLVEVARKHWPREAIWQMHGDEIHVMSFAGRLASESPDCFARAWNRLCCINWENYREYGQPYFAMNPNEADQ